MQLRNRILLVLCVVAVGMTPIFGQRSKDTDSEVSTDAYQGVLETIINTKIKKLLETTGRPTWLITATITPPFDEKEIFLGFARFDNGMAHFVAVVPESKSVYKQMRKLANDSFNKVKSKNIDKIRLFSRKADSATCKELLNVFLKWEKLEVPLVLENQLLLDSTGYEIDFENSYGNRLNVRLSGGNFERIQGPPILKLLRDTYNSCP